MWHKSALGLEENLICGSSLREDQIRSTRLWYHDVVMIQLFIWYCTFEAQLFYIWSDFFSQFFVEYKIQNGFILQIGQCCTIYLESIGNKKYFEYSGKDLLMLTYLSPRSQMFIITIIIIFIAITQQPEQDRLAENQQWLSGIA